MDTTPPTSTVNALPAQTTSTSFTVSVTGSDPAGERQHAVGSRLLRHLRLGRRRAVHALATVTPADPSAAFTGQAGPHLRLLQRGDRQRRQRPAHADRGPADRPDRRAADHHLDRAGLAQPAQHRRLEHRRHLQRADQHAASPPPPDPHRQRQGRHRLRRSLTPVSGRPTYPINGLAACTRPRATTP